MNELVIRSEREWNAFAVAVLTAAGTPEVNAHEVAGHLVEASLRGMDTHGVVQLVSYVDTIRRGWVEPAAVPEVTSDGPAFALVSGRWGWGIVAAELAMRLAVEKAGTHGVAVVGLVECDHIGRLGAYAERAADAGMLSSVWVGGVGVELPLVAPFGGAAAILSGNPIALGYPGPDGEHVVADFSTMSHIPQKIDEARERGVRLPEGVLVDPSGRPTTDPGDFGRGGVMLPFGGHKGSSLLLGLEITGRILTAADRYAANAQNRNPQYRYQGVTFTAIRSDLFADPKEYETTMRRFSEEVRTSRPQVGVQEVLLPGDLERRTREQRLKDGIPVDAATWAALGALAGSLGVEL